MDECVRIIGHAECRLGWEITFDEVSEGTLKELLLPEDYASITQVMIYFILNILINEVVNLFSFIFTCFYRVLIVAIN